jgi:hypothetical protein
MGGVAEASQYKQLIAVSGTTSSTTDAGQVYDTMRLTSSGLTPSTTTTQSAEIDPNRKAPADIRTNATGAGDIGIEFSAVTYDKMMRGVMMHEASDWDAAAACTPGGSGFSFAKNTGIVVDLDSSAAFTSVTVGDVVTVASAEDSANDGSFAVVEKISNNSIRLSHGLMWNESTSSLATNADDTAATITREARVTIGTWKVPVWTEREFYDGIESDPVHREFYGYTTASINPVAALMSTFGLSFTPGSIGTGTFGIQGGFPYIGPASTSTKLRSGTDSTTTPTTTVPINGLDDVTKIVLAPMANTKVVNDANNYVARTTEFSFNYDNQIRDDAAVGAFGTVNTGLGTPNLTGTLNVYLYHPANQASSREAIDHLIANDQLQLSFFCGDAAGNVYAFVFSEATLTNAETPVTGNNAATLANLSWSARSFTISRILV